MIASKICLLNHSSVDQVENITLCFTGRSWGYPDASLPPPQSLPSKKIERMLGLPILRAKLQVHEKQVRLKTYKVPFERSVLLHWTEK